MSTPAFEARPPAQRVSLIATVKDEAENIAALLDSMLVQTRPPDEIVINDNSSSDGTAAIVKLYVQAGHRIRLVAGGFNIPSGRNNAIRHAEGPFIASCDAGLTLPPWWLECITAPLLQGTADVVAGFYEPAPRSLWELALGATNYADVTEVDPEVFLPAGMSMAFTKAAWSRAGGFPEWADTCEDLVFGMKLRREGARFSFVPEAAVRHRPRPSPRAYMRQYYAYARGDGVADLFRTRHAARYGSYLGLVTLLLGARRRPAMLLLLLPGIALHTYRPYRRLWPRTETLSPGQRLAALALVPVIRLLGDVAKMAGYPVGAWRRLRAGPRARSRSWPVKAIDGLEPELLEGEDQPDGSSDGER